MWSWLLLAPALYLAMLGETSLVGWMAIGPIAPSLLGPLAVMLVLLRRGDYDFLLAGACGLAADLTSPGPLGLQTALYLVGGFWLNHFGRGWGARFLIGRLAATALLVLLVAFVDACAAKLAQPEAISAAMLAQRPLLIALYSTALSAPIWMLLGWANETQRAPTVGRVTA